MHIIQVGKYLFDLRFETVAMLAADAKAGALSDAASVAIQEDLSAKAVNPTTIEQILAAIEADLPAILALIAALAPLFAG